MNKVIKTALFDSIATLVYIVLVAFFIFFMRGQFRDTPDTIFVPIAVLILFVFSAAITGFLVFGRPILWYLDGKKKEGLSLLAWTLVFLFLFLIIAFSMAIYSLSR